METAWTKANAKKFKLNQMPITLKTSKVQFIKATITQRRSLLRNIKPLNYYTRLNYNPLKH